MKSYFVAAALFAGSSLAWIPECAWNDCMSSVDLGACDQSTGWACLCNNQTLISQLNTCVSTSCTNETDQEAIYGAVAQLCVNNGVTVTNSEQATFSATSGGSLITAGPSGGPGGRFGGDWNEWVSSCSNGLGGPPSGWSSGQGPWGNHGWGGPGGPGGRGGGGPFGGPWGTKASGINCDAWTTWTAGWGPFSSWTGTWSGCSSTTDAPVPATVTTTINGQVVTGTTFGVQAAAQSSGNAGSTVVHVSTRIGLTTFGAIAVAVFGAMVHCKRNDSERDDLLESKSNVFDESICCPPAPAATLSKKPSEREDRDGLVLIPITSKRTDSTSRAQG
ncbi:uncharacterized protein AB675_9680 [Cyphellophora attinorum]|uniref:CFEM domain-containing protein n=1 Tax=Cyphellophora attinorum TaxID=1664694 RepID=A0A0N0NPH2_9EURO|nr:uncharacterized protein AB675_9680 [Phialophora attinorum]KPI42539.1 hypothetical protein AB675_9680 [Phialophora attinorum]